MANDVDIEFLRTWIGRSESVAELLAPFPADALAATLETGDPPFAEGAAVPPMWHLVYGLTAEPMTRLGYDGHPALGGFLPPVPLPRRMWAGGQLAFHRPLRIGSRVTRTATVTDVASKPGRSGPLVFVTVRYEFADADGVAVSEVRDVVYRPPIGPAASAPPPARAPAKAVWRRTVEPDAVMLFRYSALTFNGHRIHYDQPFATRTEGYPGLVVHGPLIATLLVDLARRNAGTARIGAFSFRALSPLFAGARFDVCGAPAVDGRTVAVWAQRPDGALAMEGTVSLA